MVSDCGGSISSTNGVITSPYLPYSSDSTQCIWFLLPNSNSMQTHYIFDEMNMQSGPTCTDNFVSVVTFFPTSTTESPGNCVADNKPKVEGGNIAFRYVTKNTSKAQFKLSFVQSSTGINSTIGLFFIALLYHS